MSSFRNGFNRILKSNSLQTDDILFFIDANRPFVSREQYYDLEKICLEYRAACLGRPVVNGVARVDHQTIVNVPDKGSHIEFVTPECISYSVLSEYFDSRCLPCHSSLIEYALSMDLTPAFSPSFDFNSKLTYPEDLRFLEGLCSQSIRSSRHSNPLAMSDLDSILSAKADRARINTIASIYAAKSGHPGGSLSCLDILNYLFYKDLFYSDLVELFFPRDMPHPVYTLLHMNIIS